MTSILINEDAEDNFDINVQDPQSAIKRLIDQGKERGFISLTELKKNLPPESQSEDAFEVILASLADMGINVIDGSEDITDLTESDKNREIGRASCRERV